MMRLIYKNKTIQLFFFSIYLRKQDKIDLICIYFKTFLYNVQEL